MSNPVATTCAVLLQRLASSGIALPAASEGTEAVLAAAAEPRALAPYRLELGTGPPEVVFIRRRDGAELRAPLDRRLAAVLQEQFAQSPIEAPARVLADGADGEPLEVRRLRLFRAAVLRADLASSDSTLAALLDALLDLTGAERGAIFLVDEDGQPRPRLHRDRDRDGGAAPPQLPQGVLERALARPGVFTSEDVCADAELYRDTVERLHIRSLLVATRSGAPGGSAAGVGSGAPGGSAAGVGSGAPGGSAAGVGSGEGRVSALCYLDRRHSPASFPPAIVELFAALSEDLWKLLDAALERERLAADLVRLEEAEPLGEVRTANPAFARVLVRLRRAAATREPVLLLGETGTGKTLLAAAVHRTSPWASGPFVHVRLPEVPEALFESELFGHEKGAFTGALAARRGLLEQADGGTLFLDEIGRLAPGLQSKLLGVLEGGTAVVRRVGGGDRLVRFRLIAATSVDLEKAAAEGGFLADLWWRLAAGLKLTVPALRDRPEDIAALAEKLLDQAALGEDLDPPPLSPEAIARLRAHPWPGNVRELRAVVQRAFWAHLAQGGERRPIGPEAIELPETSRASEPADAYDRALRAAGWAFPSGSGLAEELEFLRGWRIRKALEACGMNEAAAARRLGYRSPSTLRSQIKSLGLELKREVAPKRKR